VSDLARHRAWLADPARMGAYQQALARALRPGDAVVSLGAGPGVLAILCARAGARHVYAIEPGPLARLARELAAANGVADRVTVLEADPRAVTLPEPADLLVTEEMGVLTLGENRLPALLDARDRLLRPGGRVLPERVEVWAAPVEAPAAWEAVMGLWLRPAYGLDLTRLGMVSRHEAHAVELPSAPCLTAPARFHVLELEGAPEAGFEAQRYLAIERDGTLHGLAVWFEAHAGGAPAFSTAPGGPLAHAGQAFFPAPRPVPVAAGTRVGLILEAIPAGPLVHWRLAVRLGDRPTMPAYGLDTRFGFAGAADPEG
jgi:protein arginine N-methyltransferase 1